MTHGDPSILTIREAAAVVRVHAKTLSRFLREGRLRGVKVGREWRIRRSDLDALLRGDDGNAGQAARGR